jgi:hypothetical protein
LEWSLLMSLSSDDDLQQFMQRTLAEPAACEGSGINPLSRRQGVKWTVVQYATALHVRFGLQT